MPSTTDALDHTIIGAPFGQLRTMLVGDRSDHPNDGAAFARLFKIRAANQNGRRVSANILVNRRYTWRGYSVSGAPSEPSADRITLVANEGDATIGTLSIGFDGASGLLVEELFGEEVTRLRDEGRRICEFTKLAIDTGITSKRVLASLFHVAYIYAYRIMAFECLLIEVNPRHVKYYQKILGFDALGPPRLNRRVNAPAVLLALDLAHTERQIEQFGGKPQMSTAERSLYPHVFSVEEEAGIVARLQTPSDATTAASRRVRDEDSRVG